MIDKIKIREGLGQLGEFQKQLQALLDTPERPARATDNVRDENDVIAENGRLEIEVQAMLKVLPKAAVRMAAPARTTDVLEYNRALTAYHLQLRAAGAVAVSPVLLEAPVEVATVADIAPAPERTEGQSISELCRQHVAEHGVSAIRDGLDGPAMEAAVASATLMGAFLESAPVARAASSSERSKSVTVTAPAAPGASSLTERCRAARTSARPTVKMPDLTPERVASMSWTEICECARSGVVPPAKTNAKHQAYKAVKG